MKSLKYILAITICLVIISCSSSDSDSSPTENNPPIANSYVLPLNNQVCTGIIETNGIAVDFEWNAFNDEEQSKLTYDLIITELSSNQEVFNQSTGNALSKTVTLEKGKSYSWYVFATDNDDQSNVGPVWQFQTPFDAINNYTPFPASLLQPVLGESLQPGNVTLTWEGNDPDTNESSQLVYDLYLRDTNPPTPLQEALSVTNFEINLTSGIYYWYVKSIDPNGNSSNSQIWQFSVE